MAALVLAQEANIWFGLAVATVASIAGGIMAFMCPTISGACCARFSSTPV